MSSIKKNMVYQSLYQILAIILPLVTSPYISRILGPEKLGIYSYTYSITSYFVIFAMLGINNYGNRAIAQVRNDRNNLNKTFSSIFCFHAFISLIIAIIYIFYILFIVNENKIYFVIQGCLVAGALFDINWFYFGIEKFKLTVVRNTIVKLLTVLAIFLFVKSKDDLSIYIFIMAFGSFVSQLSVWMYIKKYVVFVKPSVQDIIKHTKPMFILFIPVIAISLYKYTGKIMIGLLSTKSQLGYFDNAGKAIDIPISIIGAFGTVMLPRMSNLVANGEFEVIKKNINNSIQSFMFLAIGLTFGIAGVSTVFAPIFWGEQFVHSGQLIKWLAITIPFLAFANILRTQYLIPQSKDKIYVVSIIIGAIVNITLNILLIPKYEAMGAVIGTIFAEITVCLIQSIALIYELPIIVYIKNCLFYIFSGTVMYLILLFIGKLMEVHIYTLIVQIVFGALLYISLCLLYFRITKNTKVINQFFGSMKK